ncbi:hypothetical protein [Aeromonas veronii]|uniref:hypothetical protein n=1 Tax=Aeromonas veronii TaxID=654 RepID=UPI00191F9258|nr:hypothetical protein [Aeromonas veronii]MBL0593176.1 hypothetical protein [Aeromonas veronii]
MSIRVWIKENKFNAVSLIIGLLGIISSYYFYAISIKAKEPVFIERTNTQIFSPNFSQNNRFALVDDSTGLKVTNGVFLQEFEIWNKGKDIIKSEDILSPINISYDKNVRIVEVYINEATRPNIIKAKYEKQANSLNLNFSILEHNDGFKVQVIYASTQKALARISGDIAGVNKFYTIDDLTKDNIFLSIGKIVLWVFIGILAIAAIIGAIYVFKAVISKAFPNKFDAISKFIEKLLGYIFFGFFIIFIILVFGTKVYQFARSEALNSTPNMVSTEDIADKNNPPPK